MQNLNCKICFNQFDHSKHKPYVLIYCTHTFCIDCIKKLKIKESTSFKCPTCSGLVSKINPNWTLLDSIPESNYDKLLSNLEQNINQVQMLRTNLKTNRDLKIKQMSQKMKDLRSEIKSKAGMSIKLIHQCQKRLIKKSKNIESSYKKKFTNLVSYERVNLAKKVEDARNYLSDNNLDETKLKSFTTELVTRKQSFSSKLDQVNKLNSDFTLDCLDLNNFAELNETLNVQKKHQEVIIYSSNYIFENFILIIFVIVLPKMHRKLSLLYEPESGCLQKLHDSI